MKVFKKTVALCLILSVLLLMSGCLDGTGADSDDFLSPPKPAGDMLDISETLKKSIDGKFTLKYPTAGEYRSAYILTDLMSTGKQNFALAFYSVLDDENTTSMHLNLMKKADDSWVTISDVSIAALGVEKVEICDLNGDGVKEITVGWNILSGVGKSVVVYVLKGLYLVPLMQESYTDFVCIDMDKNSVLDLFVISHNSSEGTAGAKLFAFDDNKAVSKGSCLIDGRVTEFYTPVPSKLNDGSAAVFIDAVKGSGTQTEIVYYKNNTLKRADFIVSEDGALSTYRNISVLCSDINNDGFYDIPIWDNEHIFTPKDYNKSSATMIRWCSYSESGFKTTLYAAMNYTDGYYLEIPVRWYGKITVEASVESRMYTVSIWNTEKNIKMGELLKIRTVTNSEWDEENNGFENYKEVKRNKNIVYIADLGNYSGTEKTNIEEVKKLLSVIGG